MSDNNYLSLQAAGLSHPEPCDTQHCPAKLEYLLRKTRLCTKYLTGQCRYGDSCNFAHNTRDLKPMPKWEMCQKSKQGICPYWYNPKKVCGNVCILVKFVPNLTTCIFHQRVHLRENGALSKAILITCAVARCTGTRTSYKGTIVEKFLLVFLTCYILRFHHSTQAIFSSWSIYLSHCHEDLVLQCHSLRACPGLSASLCSH